MIIIRRCLIAALLCMPLAESFAAADNWTVYPTTQTNCTGYTDYAAKHDGPILIYGGATTGTVRKGNGYLKFDVSAIPDGTVFSAVEWHYYVSSGNWPYWTVTPLTADPASMAGTPPLVWEDLEAESLDGYYNLLNESSVFDPGWKTLVLGGRAASDLTGALGQDWFAFGGVSRDSSSGYGLVIDGHTEPNVPYLVVSNFWPDPCGPLTVIAPVPGTSSYLGTTDSSGDDFNCTAPCVGGLDHAGGDVLYRLDLPAGCQVCATLNQSEMDWNGGLYMITDCLDENGTCVAGASGWVAGGPDEEFCFTTPVSQTYYIVVDSRTNGGTGPFQLDIDVGCLAGPTELSCTDAGNRVDLVWTNNEVYDSLEVHVDGVLESTLPGNATGTSVSPEDGWHCFQVCGRSGTELSCSDDCCLLFGYDIPQVTWDFEEDNGGFMVEGTGNWEWGEATFGPCSESAFGKLWATGLHQEYLPDSCWLLDSPPVILGSMGAFLSIDHCYDTELTYDGGVVWFTTDDFWYNTSDPVKGSDGTITANPGCTWVAGQQGFTGDSAGWVNDIWDLTDPIWQDQPVKIRFAFGADSGISAPGWMIDNVTFYINLNKPLTCDYTITPLAGTVPFQTVHSITLYNNLSGGAVLTRRIAGEIAVTLGNGSYINPWKAGYTNITPSSNYSTQFPVNIPALGSVIGTNTFNLAAMDVTPAPYNQPPYPPSGGTCTRLKQVTATVP